MGSFRILRPEDVVRALDAFGERGYRRHEALEVGTINTNLRVETESGTFFLRVNEGKAPDDVAHEAAIVAWLAERGVPTPAPLRATDGRPFAALAETGILVSMFAWVPGGVVRRAEVRPDHARQVGLALARLHVAGGGFPDRRAGRYEPDEIRRRLTALSAAPLAELAEDLAVLTPELHSLESEREPDLAAGLIHGDLFPDNVLFEGDRLSALLDFEQASWGRLAYDLAVTTLAFGFGVDEFSPDVVRALLEAYAAARPPDAADRRGFGAELRFAACRFSITRITDVHLRRGQGAPPGKDYRRFVRRLVRVREHLAAGDGLFDLP